MKYMLDTNICIYAIKHKPPEVIKNFLKHDPDDMWKRVRRWNATV